MSHVVRLEYAYGVCPKCNHGDYLRYLIHNDGLIHKPYEIKCTNCNSYFTREDIWGRGEETAPKPTTNGDKLRSMSDEELAAMKKICRVTAENLDECEKWRFPDGSPDCYSCALDWLRQEASE